MFIFYFLLGAILIIEFARHIIFGKLITEYKLKEYYVNSLDNRILGCKDSSFDYIAMIPFPGTITAKYYINNAGSVWRWSQLHKDIENLYKTCDTLQTFIVRDII